MKNVLMYIWQLPQHILGLLVICRYRIIVSKKYGTSRVYVFSGDEEFAVSLGQYIFIHEHWYSDKIVKHEYGHSIQSRRLGWLYLLVVGIPSVVQNMLSKVLRRLGYPAMYLNYYKRFPENWADRLGGVD